MPKTAFYSPRSPRVLNFVHISPGFPTYFELFRTGTELVQKWIIILSADWFGFTSDMDTSIASGTTLLFSWHASATQFFDQGFPNPFFKSGPGQNRKSTAM